MGLKRIFDPDGGRAMRVACFISGSGTNARRIIERSLESDSRYQVVLVFTDVKDERRLSSGEKRCRAKEIADEYDITYECVDIRDFYHSRGHETRLDLSLRPAFDQMVFERIEPYGIDLIANAGYMSVMTHTLLDEYSGRIVNVHPADISIMHGDERKYVGMHGVRDAILAGEKELRAAIHVVRERVDYGEILVISKPVEVRLPEGVALEQLRQDKQMLRWVVREHQRQLKERGEWVIYPLTLQMIAEGRFSLDEKGNVYIDGSPEPGGLRL